MLRKMMKGALVCILGIVLVNVSYGILYGLLGGSNSELTAHILSNLIVAVFMGGIFLHIKKYKIMLDTDVKRIIVMVVISAPLVFYLCQALIWIVGTHSNVYPDGIEKLIFLNAVDCASVACMEEILFRLICIDVVVPESDLKKKKVIPLALYSAFMFALSHSVVFIFQPTSSAHTNIILIVMSFIAGIVFSVLYIEGNIVFPIIIHFLWDYAAYTNSVMIKKRYQFGQHYSFITRQMLMLILMLVGIALIASCSIDYRRKNDCSLGEKRL